MANEPFLKSGHLYVNCTGGHCPVLVIDSGCAIHLWDKGNGIRLINSDYACWHITQEEGWIDIGNLSHTLYQKCGTLEFLKELNKT